MIPLKTTNHKEWIYIHIYCLISTIVVIVRNKKEK